LISSCARDMAHGRFIVIAISFEKIYFKSFFARK
jgi:hypothetical protein